MVMSAPVAGAEIQSVERHVPGPGGVLDEGDLVPVAVQQPGAGIVEIFKLVLPPVRGLVSTAKLLLPLPADQMVCDHRRHQRGARVIEMDDPAAAAGFQAGAVDVDGRMGHG